MKTLRISKLPAAMMILLFACNAVAAEDQTTTEVNYLLDAIGTSQCIFVRNGKEHSAKDAQDHLAMKFRRGKRYVLKAEDFINRLASESSWTGEVYQVKCPGKPVETSRDWLTDRLIVFRTSENL